MISYYLKQSFSIGIFSLMITLYFAKDLSAANCTGRFVNPITDICWECMFPITIGSFEVIGGKIPDTDNPSSPICICPRPVGPVVVPVPGISGGFWEPARLVDVTKRPFCFPSIGGMEINMGMKVGKGNGSRSNAPSDGSWHVHWYIYPLIYWLSLITDFICLEHGDFDIGYITELDPLWLDDSLTFIINPEVILFANPIAQAACMADCASATASLPMDSLFWCAGCQGSLYPLSGNIQAHITSIQSSLLAVERMTYKLHRELINWGTSGTTNEQICAKYPMPFMKKSQYRSQLVVPVPTDNCYPFGHATVTYEGGKEIPIVGEDFGYLIWRKRNCCIL